MPRELIYEGCEKQERGLVGITYQGEKREYELRKGTGNKIKIELEPPSALDKAPDGEGLYVTFTYEVKEYDFLGELMGSYVSTTPPDPVITPINWGERVEVNTYTNQFSNYYIRVTYGQRTVSEKRYEFADGQEVLTYDLKLVDVNLFDSQGNQYDPEFPELGIGGGSNKWRVFLSQEESGSYVEKFVLDYDSMPERIAHNCECHRDCLKVHDRSDEEDHICVCRD